MVKIPTAQDVKKIKAQAKKKQAEKKKAKRIASRTPAQKKEALRRKAVASKMTPAQKKKAVEKRKKERAIKGVGKVLGGYAKVGSAIGKGLTKKGNAKKQADKLQSAYKRGVLGYGASILL